MASIFDRIFRYRQSEERTPREDYFTEIFVAILEKHEALNAAFIGCLTSRDDIKTVDIQTQRSFGDVHRRVDIYAKARDGADRSHIVIIENKIDASEGDGQLAAYMKLLEEEREADSRTLVYITKRSEAP